MSTYLPGTIPLEELAQILRAAKLAGYISSEGAGAISRGIITQAGLAPSRARARLFLFKAGVVDSLEDEREKR